MRLPDCPRLQRLTDTRHLEYDKNKYVWKLLYIYMLGYEVEFGHKQAADLIPASKCACSRLAAELAFGPPADPTRPRRYAEKQVGYMACAILLNEVRLGG